MHSHAHLEADPSEPGANANRTPHGPRRAVEGKETIAGDVELPAAEPPELPPHRSMVRLDQPGPTPIADLDRPLGGAHEIGEEDGRQHPVGVRPPAHAGEEILDLVDDLVGLDPRQVVISLQLDEPCARNAVGKVAALLDARIAVARAVQDDRRNADGGQDVTHVDLAVHEDEIACCPGARRRAGAPEPPVRERPVHVCPHPNAIGRSSQLAAQG